MISDRPERAVISRPGRAKIAALSIGLGSAFTAIAIRQTALLTLKVAVGPPIRGRADHRTWDLIAHRLHSIMANLVETPDLCDDDHPRRGNAAIPISRLGVRSVH